MRNKVKDIAASIVMVCFAVAAACGDCANNGDVKAYILAGVCVIIAGVASEISWRGGLDEWDETE